MKLNTAEEKDKLREMIQSLAEKMHERKDPWILKDCTAREDSWYNRHLRAGNKQTEEKKERSERV